MSTQDLSPSDRRKAAAAHTAADRITSGMILGLGTGTTASFFLRELAHRLEAGTLADIRGVPTSRQAEELAQNLGIPLTTLESDPVLDVAVDGADEIDPRGNAIKGGGGALLREKIVAQAAKVFIIIVEAEKCSTMLGETWALPVEVIPFGWRTQSDFLARLGAQVTLRTTYNKPFLTDSGNYILDSRFTPRANWTELAHSLKCRTGIVEHGLFLDMAHELLIADDEHVQVLTPNRG
ncbi:MAG: ribose-5-phosphate isomerase RpiA [Litorilinea sp.]